MPEALDAPLRLVVIGAGPKALFALEALAARLEDGECATSDGKDGEPELSPVPPCPSAPRQLEVSVVDPGEHPGTGAAYAPDQPHELRLNVSPRLLDAAAGEAFPSFEEWTGRHAPQHAARTSPPRAVVGDYLTQRWRRMTDRLGTHARCRHLAARATSVQEEGAGWRIALDGDPEHSTPLTADEVLVATGHGAGHDGALAMGWSAPLPLVPAVLPARTMLSPAAVPPGARVALRGAALTFLDAALALTEGRGAEFVPSSERSRPLLHRRSPLEPSVLLPTARHGLLLEAKPVPGTALATPRSAALADGARRLTELRADDADVVRRLLGVLTMTSARLLEEVGEADRTYGPDVEQTLSDGAEPDLPVGPGRAEEALRRSVAVARGERAPGPAWALGRTWARLYPQVTALLRGSTLDEDRWAELRTAAQVLERFAFGPPLETAEKLLAMVDSGAVDLSWVDARTTITATGPQGIPRGSDGPDLVIDAVLAPPGLLHLTDPLARHLLDSGAVSVRPGRRGAAVAPDGTALGADGRRREGLALLGRPTEDHVIGHDTLDRHLHDEGEHWAARLADRLTLHAARLPGETG